MYAVIEVGSTNTKAYLVQDKEIKDAGFRTIEFKNHYKINNEIAKEDKEILFDLISTIDADKIYTFGTSIFRNLNDDQKNAWKQEFKIRTGYDFHIVSASEENEYTVYGAIANTNYDGNIAVMIGGGGSTELSICSDNKIIESVNYSFGAIDTTDMFPELKTDKATTDYELMVKEVKKLVNPPKEKADLLILAGGDYIYFYEELNYRVKLNQFYDNSLHPYSVDIESMDKFDKDFFYNVSLEEICRRTNNDAWWRGARGMRLCVKAMVDTVSVKYIIPTRINMIYGIVEKINNGEIQ